MKTSYNGLQFIIREEGVKLSSYLDSANIWTIGVGFTYYSDKTKVKRGDTITEEENSILFESVILEFEKNLNRQLTTSLTQNQYDALISLMYNIGITAFNNSTLLKEVNKNPNNPRIKFYIEQWRYATIKGAKEPILYKRRERESKLYFTYD